MCGAPGEGNKFTDRGLFSPAFLPAHGGSERLAHLETSTMALRSPEGPGLQHNDGGPSGHSWP